MSPERTVGTYAARGGTGWGRLIPSSSRRCSGDAIADLLLAGSCDRPPLFGVPWPSPRTGRTPAPARRTSGGCRCGPSLPLGIVAAEEPLHVVDGPPQRRRRQADEQPAPVAGVRQPPIQHRHDPAVRLGAEQSSQRLLQRDGLALQPHLAELLPAAAFDPPPALAEQRVV